MVPLLSALLPRYIQGTIVAEDQPLCESQLINPNHHRSGSANALHSKERGYITHYY
jgi:hypothetical protein